MPSRSRKSPPDPLRDELVAAVSRGDLSRTQELLARGARPDAIAVDRGPVVSYAASQGHWEVVRALIRAGADINARSSDRGYTPLFWAVLHGSLDAVHALFELGADPRVKDRWGNTVLNKVCSGFALDSSRRLDVTFCRVVARRLLDAGLDPDAPNDRGMTPRVIALDPNLRGPVADLFRDLPPHGEVPVPPRPAGRA